MPNNYLFKNVSEEDYAFLKERQQSILNQVKNELMHEGVTEKEMEKFERNKPTFRYNSHRRMIGIFLKEGKLYRLILSHEDYEIMSNFERKVFHALRSKLEEGLEGIRIRKEFWE
jgi:hypothetical protein